MHGLFPNYIVPLPLALWFSFFKLKVGKTMARKLVLDMGLKTLDEVKAAVSSGQVEFSQNQLIGLDCWEDFREKMKRTEVEKVGEIVEKATLERFPSAQVTIMGSYRRGKPTSGDIDILILVPEFVKTTPRGAIDELVERLRRQGHISHHLSKVRLTKEDTCREQQIVPITGTTHIATYPSSQSCKAFKTNTKLLVFRQS